MNNVSGEIQILRKNKKEILEIKNIGTEMKNKNASDGLISRLDMGEERLSELQATAIETTKAEKQREKNKKQKPR